MAYWRMQLHPNEPHEAVRYAAESLAAGFIGLGFGADPGDLATVADSDLEGAEVQYRRFEHEMEVGDVVLVFAHHFPFAAVEVRGGYNYIKEPVGHLGVWFRHFRRAKVIRYYGDHVLDAHRWERLTMTATLTPLRRDDTASYRLLDEMVAAAAGG